MPDDPKHSTEAAYDDHMAPLVARLIEIAKRTGVALFVTAGMLDGAGAELGCTTIIPGCDALAGYNNRIGLMGGIAQGHNGFDTASGLMITQHHLTPDQEAKAAKERDQQSRLRRLWRATRANMGPADCHFDAPLTLVKTDDAPPAGGHQAAIVWRLSENGGRRWSTEPFLTDDPIGVVQCWESRLGLPEWADFASAT